MSDFLERLAARALASEPAVRPRLRGFFEPLPVPGQPVLEEVEAWPEVAPPPGPVAESRPGRSPEPRTREVSEIRPVPGAGTEVRQPAPPTPQRRATRVPEEHPPGPPVAAPEMPRPASRAAAPPVPTTDREIPTRPPLPSETRRDTAPLPLPAVPTAVPDAVIEVARRPAATPASTASPAPTGTPSPTVPPAPAVTPVILRGPGAPELVEQRVVRHRTEIVARPGAAQHLSEVSDQPPASVPEPPAVAPVVQRIVPRVEPPRHRPLPPEAVSAPTVKVTIGRLEIRATPADRPGQRSRRSAAAVMGLDEYLKQRAGGGR